MATKCKHVGGQGLAVAERDALSARDDGELSACGHKAGDVEVEHAARFDELAVVAIQGELKAFVAVGHGQHRGACFVVHHQGAGGFGRGGDGAAGLHGLQRDRLGHGFVAGHQGRHVGAQQAAAKAELQLAAGVKAQAGSGGGACDAGQGRCDRSLHLVLGHVGAQGAGGDGACAVRQGQRVIHLRLSAGNDHALHLAGALLALGQVGGRDNRQAEVACGVAGRAKVAADVGHIGEGERATKGECEACFTRVGATLRGHSDLARAKQGIHALLQVGAQLGRVGVVTDGRAVGAHTVNVDRDLEAALRQLCIDRDGADHHGRDVHARQCATKAHQVSIGAIGGDADRAQAAQGGGARQGRAQSGLHLRGARAKGQALAHISLARMAETQHEAALGVSGAVQAQALDFGHGRGAVGQQGVVQLGAGYAYAFGVDVHPGQRAHKAHHIALACRAAAKGHVNVSGGDGDALVAIEQLGVGRLEVGDVGRRVAHHKVAADAAAGAGGACALGLQGHHVEVLAGQRAAHGELEGVLRSRAHLAQRDRDGRARDLAKGRIHRCLNLRLAGGARNHGGGVGLAFVREAQAVALLQGLVAQHHPLLLLLTADAGLHRAHIGAGVGQGRGVQAERIDVFAGQAAHKLNVQAQAAGVGLRWVEADLDVARAHIGQARQLGLHAGGQGHPVA